VTNAIEITRPRQAEAAAIMEVIPSTLSRRGLAPEFCDWALTEEDGMTWLFGAIDTQKVGRLEAYMSNDLLHHLSTDLGGRQVHLSNSSGLRYAVLLSPPPQLPKRADFPGFQRGAVQLGIDAAGRTIKATWADLGHMMVPGMTRSGKSAFLRMLVYQALLEGCRLLLSDVDGATFPMLEGNPALLAPIAGSAEEALEIVECALAECENRSNLFKSAPGFPEKLEEYNTVAAREGLPQLPRIIVILDEFNATVAAGGGYRGTLARAAARLAWRGLKFGITLIFAAQDFSKEVVGQVRNQVGTVIGFRVRSLEVARRMGIEDAFRIAASRPGTAVTDRWGPMQAFYLPKEALVELAGKIGPVAARGILTPAEREMVAWAQAERGGRLTIPDIQARMGIGQKPARRLADEWEARGWLRKDANENNARVITPELARIATD